MTSAYHEPPVPSLKQEKKLMDVIPKVTGMVVGHLSYKSWGSLIFLMFTHSFCLTVFRPLLLHKKDPWGGKYDVHLVTLNKCDPGFMDSTLNKEVQATHRAYDLPQSMTPDLHF
ncbi:uncharacterized protein ARMOST_04128 [Armillaria ostoyae]|uniref:Uncharacterized protein n=1 Tax=Armillaria ostoyae TaxID=47428 RepID=A0A284QWI3_ARMOS|nr:uncharacterized protein ARMOST_04128 [Armillaria ostoyae]